MWLIVLKWICFILACFDVIAYIVNKTKTMDNDIGFFIGISIGTAARAFVLYGAATCWLLG